MIDSSAPAPATQPYSFLRWAASGRRFAFAGSPTCRHHHLSLIDFVGRYRREEQWASAPGWRNGIRSRLKIGASKGFVGSTPTPGIA